MDEAMSEPDVLERPARVRTKFPEAWVWTDLFYGYILYRVQKIGFFSCSQLQKAVVKIAWKTYLNKACVHVHGFFFLARETLAKGHS